MSDKCALIVSAITVLLILLVITFFIGKGCQIKYSESVVYNDCINESLKKLKKDEFDEAKELKLKCDEYKLFFQELNLWDE